MTQTSKAQQILTLRAQKLPYKAIARRVQCSEKYIGRVLSKACLATQRTPYNSVEEMLKKRCLWEDDCLVWQTDSRTPAPIGKYQGKQQRVPRLVYECTHGKLGKNYRVFQTCGNTMCCNVFHLTLKEMVLNGTQT